ncbi:hypothetical protein IIA95_01160 [Patescibacteria group bacterium]|nr:hypothetical protein [Patescibacteria group bacterium]
MEFFGFTLGMIGKVMVAYTAIRVHYRFRKEHRIDERVFVTMRREQTIGIAGIVLIVIGYTLEASIRFWI